MKSNSFFHFHEQCEVRQIDATHFEVTRGEAGLALQVAPSLACQLYRGAEAPIAGWTSERFGVKTPAFTLRAHASITGTTEFLTVITVL